MHVKESCCSVTVTDLFVFQSCAQHYKGTFIRHLASLAVKHITAHSGVAVSHCELQHIKSPSADGFVNMLALKCPSASER